MNSKQSLYFLVLLFLLLPVEKALANGGVPQLLPFQGRITDLTGNPINYPVTVKFRIYPPLGACYLYEDTQALIPTSYGMISVMLGTPANSTGPVNSFINVFSNRSTLTLVDSCAGTYSPALSDWRRLELVIDGVPMSGMQTIAAAPFSLNTQLIDGLTSSQLIQVQTTLTQANALSLTNGSDASTLHNHDSTYVRVDGANPFTGDITTTQNIVTTSTTGKIGVGTGTPGADIEVAKNSPNIRLSADAGMGGTSTLDFYGGAFKRASIVAQEGSNGLKIYSGATLAVDVSSAGNMLINNSAIVNGTFGLGRYTTVQEGPLIIALTGLGAAATGTMWVNSTVNTLRYWNGAVAITLSNASTSVQTATAGTGLSNSGTATDPVFNVSYGSAASTAIQGNTTFAGDVSGNYTALSVDKLKGYPIDFSAAPVAAQNLVFNGTSWLAQTPATLPVTKGGTGVTVLTANGVLAMNALGTQVTSNVLNNGELLIGSTGSVPVAAGLTAGAGISVTAGAGSINVSANLTGTANQVVVTNGAGSVTLSTPQNIDSGATPTFVGQTLSSGALTSTVANGAAAKAFTMNTSGAYTTTAKLMSVQNNGSEKFAVAQDGSVTGTAFTAAGGSIAAADVNIVGPSAAINFATGNIQILQSASGAALTLSGMISGGAYSLIVADTTVRTYTFGGQCAASSFIPVNAATQATKKSIYTIIYTTNIGGGTCFISWVSGL